MLRMTASNCLSFFLRSGHLVSDEQPKLKVLRSFPFILSRNSPYLSCPLYVTSLVWPWRTVSSWWPGFFTTLLCQCPAQWDSIYKANLRVHNQFKFLKPSTTRLLDWHHFACIYIHSLRTRHRILFNKFWSNKWTCHDASVHSLATGQ